MRALLLLSLLAALPACGDDPPEGSPACDNLDEGHCLFPFPSDRYRTSTAAGPSLAFPGEALPVSTAGRGVDPTYFHRQDGFSIVTPILFSLQDASLAGTATKHDIDASLASASKTVLLDAETGERWPHFVELDYLAEATAPTIVLRVARPLRFGRRYVVGVRGLVDDRGVTLPPTRGFAALRDDARSPVVGIDERRARFEAEVFPVLARAGVARDELQLAWDFTTTSEASATHVLSSMRTQLFAALGTDGPEYAITKVEELADGPIARVLTGVARVPSFLLPKDDDGIKRVRYDAGGEPVLQGTIDAEFTLQIPRSVWDAAQAPAPVPAAVLQYGHGFLGAKNEANGAWLREWANRDGFLILATDMEGMNEEAAATWLARLPDDLSTAPLLADWPHQGIMNHLALQRMMKGRFLRETDPRVTRSGAPLYDPDRLYYHGNSQGGTIGNIVISNSADVTRALFGVPGVALSFLVHRASQWQVFTSAISARYPGRRDISAIMGLVQVAFDRFEPTYYLRRLTDDPFPGLPAHRALIHAALGDAQVNNDVSQLFARVAGARLLQPALRPVWGLESMPAPMRDQNAYVEFDFGVPLDMTGNRPEATETDTHTGPRKSLLAQRQGWHFLTTGEIIQTCDGACDPS